MNPTRTPQHVATPSRIVDDLVVVRGSRNDRELTRRLILDTHHQYSDLAGHSALLDAADSPLFDPGKYGATEEHEGGTFAVLFHIDGTYCLYARGSAASHDAGDDNGFATILSRTIRRLRPVNVRVANFSRLARRIDMAGDVKKALVESRSTLWADGYPMPMTEPHGMAIFDVVAMMAKMERRELVSQRIRAGRRHSRRGR